MAQEKYRLMAQEIFRSRAEDRFFGPVRRNGKTHWRDYGRKIPNGKTYDEVYRDRSGYKGIGAALEKMYLPEVLEMMLEPPLWMSFKEMPKGEGSIITFRRYGLRKTTTKPTKST